MLRLFVAALIIGFASSNALGQVVGNRAPAVDTSGNGDFITASSPLPDGGTITSTVYGGSGMVGPNYYVAEAPPQNYAPMPGYASQQYDSRLMGQAQQLYSQPQNPYPPRYASNAPIYGNSYQTRQDFASSNGYRQAPQQQRFAQANWPTTANNYGTNANNNAGRDQVADRNFGNYQIQPQISQANYQQPAGQSFQNNLNGLQWRTASRTNYNPNCCGQTNTGFYQQPPVQPTYANPNPNPYGAGYGFNRSPVGYGGYPQPGYGGYPQPGFRYAPTNPYGNAQTWRPLIPLRQIPPGVYVGQGIIGQPVAYVNDEPFRNFLRYISP